jgi:hypothetical protein
MKRRLAFRSKKFEIGGEAPENFLIFNSKGLGKKQFKEEKLCIEKALSLARTRALWA